MGSDLVDLLLSADIVAAKQIKFWKYGCLAKVYCTSSMLSLERKNSDALEGMQATNRYISPAPVPIERITMRRFSVPECVLLSSHVSKPEESYLYCLRINTSITLQEVRNPIGFAMTEKRFCMNVAGLRCLCLGWGKK